VLVNRPVISRCLMVLVSAMTNSRNDLGVAHALERRHAVDGHALGLKSRMSRLICSRWSSRPITSG
jgi:hypothetical protein